MIEPRKLSDLLVSYSPPELRDGGGNTVNLERAVKRFQLMYGVGAERSSPTDLAERLTEFETRYSSNNWDRYPWHEASDLLRSFFSSEDLSENRWEKVCEILLETLKVTDRKNFCRAALDAYLLTYGSNTPRAIKLKETLECKANENFVGQKELLDCVDVFDASVGHLQLGSRMAKSANPYTELKQLGAWSPHAQGFFFAAFKAMLEELSGELNAFDEEAFNKVMKWLRPDQQTKAEIGRAEGVDALVLPFAKGGPAALRDQLERFLVDTYNDPRVSLPAWSGVSDKALAIVKRWLTSKSLKVFFDIIDRFEGSHMWEPRRKFWMEADKDDLIDDAWVVLNWDGQRIAQNLAKQYSDPTFKTHGKISDSGEKCYFIMRIGRLTVVEGTHSFKVRFFKDQSSRGPNLGLRDYQYHQLVVPASGCDEAFTHDVNNRWMQKTRDYIRRNK